MVRIAAATVSAIAVALVVVRLRPLVVSRRAERQARPRTLPGLDISPAQFWATSIGVAVVAFILVFAITGLAAVSLAPAVVVATLPKAYFARQRSKRLAAVQAVWPDGLRDLIASVRSGASLPSAIESMAVYGPEPLRDAFAGFDVYSRSLGVAQALEMIREDLADPTSDRVIEVLILAYERGGPVVPEILSDLAEAATRDAWAMEQVESEALEQKINSRIVFVLPWLVLVAMTSQSPAFREFYSTSTGVMVVVAGGALSAVGMILAARLGRQPTEPRVLGGRR